MTTAASADDGLQLHLSLPGRLQLEHHFAPGRITGIFGHSGAGKSTLLRAIAGLDQLPVNSLTFAGQDWRALATAARPVSMVFQDGHLFPHLDVAGNLAFAARLHKARAGTCLNTTEAVARCAIGHLLGRTVAELSGGERQRVALARALMAPCQVLLLDEPLSALDKPTRRSLLPMLAGLRDLHNLTVLYVSHDLAEVTALADDLLVLAAGAVLAAGPVPDLTTRLDLPVAQEDDAFAAIDAHVAGHDDHYQLTRLLLGGSDELTLPGRHGLVGQRVRVRIPARDVAVARQPMAESSMLNSLAVSLEESTINQQNSSSQVMLALRLASGQRLLSRITRRSHDQLRLAQGDQLYALVKSAALDGNP